MPNTNERYCLHCEKLGHYTSDCWSTHGLNHPADLELSRLTGIDHAMRALAATAPNAGVPLASIDLDEDMDRTYIPLPGGWEVQTQGKGSSFRLCDTKSGQRWIITDKMAHKAIEQMARDVHAAAPAQQAGAPLALAPSDWWRKRADEIEAWTARTGSTDAMRCFTDMRTLLQSATAAIPPQATLPASEAVAWVRCHPDGTLTEEILPDRLIEPARKASGGWVPLIRGTRAQAQALPSSQAGGRYCNKCGYFGPDMQHQRPSGSGECHYLSTLTRAQPQADAAGEPKPIPYDPKNVIGLNVAVPQADAAEPVPFAARAMQRMRDMDDAARYRMVRRGQHWSVIDGAGDTLRADALDAAVDAVIAARGEKAC